MKTHAVVTAAVMVAFAIVTAGRMESVYAAGKGKKKAAAKKAERCMKYSEAQAANGDYELTLANGCGSSRECTVSWTLTCEGQDPDKQQQDITLLDSGDHTWTIQTSKCEGAYRVSAPTWSCSMPAPLTAAQ